MDTPDGAYAGASEPAVWGSEWHGAAYLPMCRHAGEVGLDVLTAVRPVQELLGRHAHQANVVVLGLGEV